MKTYCLGDPHGNFKGVVQATLRSGFKPQEDRMIILGDICDGFSEVRECIDLFLRWKNVILIRGNHDEWALEWFNREDPYHNVVPERYWTEQGGRSTLKSYKEGMPKTHIKFLQSALPYYIDEKNNLYVHGGFNPSKHIEEQSYQDLMWDRDLLRIAQHKHNQKPDYKYGDYNLIFVGHTTTQCYKTTEPLRYCNVIDLDTGGGFSGKITIMDRDSGEFWQSDLAKELYPEESGRR